MNDKKKFLLRLDARWYDALEKWAVDDLRSINSQIEYILKEALRRTGRLPKPSDSKEAKSKEM